MKWILRMLSVFLLCIAILSLAAFPGSCQSVNFFFEHQDPAGDVLKFNATLNGTPSEDFQGLDIKWLTSEQTGDHLVITLDLKSKESFRQEDGTKYVFRILTASDNSTGVNITYRNGTTTLNSFSVDGNGTKEDLTALTTLRKDKGDEILELKVPVKTYLANISHYGLDAYSMKVTYNATYLDYISELPGHPEYVNPEVAEEEDLPNTGGGGEGDDDDDTSLMGVAFGGLICIIVAVIGLFVLVVIIVVVVILVKRK